MDKKLAEKLSEIFVKTLEESMKYSEENCRIVLKTSLTTIGKMAEILLSKGILNEEEVKKIMKGEL